VFGPQYAHIGGELSSLKDQVETLENDLAEFENVNRRYKDQLVKVKVGRPTESRRSWTNRAYPQMSDMANNDLEKYAKALDKYETCSILRTGGLTILLQCDHEVSLVKDGRGERYHETPLE